ncbi:hypothetical protein [Kitasatospora sp. NPDC089509]|uniref:hypothetical protein n=1 Tax=Kitasatospora sp. NPDC089509 TaxID=3364079 RepID=UPI0038270458
MNTSDNTLSVRPSRVQNGLVTGMLGAGALTTLAAVLLIAGAFTANPNAGETGQPAGVLGAVALFLGGTLLAVGALGRSILRARQR